LASLSYAQKIWNAIEIATKVRPAEAIDLRNYQDQLTKILCSALDCSYFDNSRMLLKAMTRVEPHDKENYAEVVAVPARYKDLDTRFSLLNPEKLKTGYFVTYKPLAEGVLVQIVESNVKFRITKDHGDGTYDLGNIRKLRDTREKVEKDKLLSVEVQWKGEKVNRTENSL